MIETEKLIGTIIISNELERDLFRVHIFENSIKFDSWLAYGISKHPQISEDVFRVDRTWREKRITKSEIFPMIISVLEKHEIYLSNYYLKQNELDINGRFVRLNTMPPDSDKTYMYYMQIKNAAKLKKIDRKTFEKNICTDDISEQYIEHYTKGRSKFYSYRLKSDSGEEKTCYIMIVQDTLSMGFIGV